MNPERSLSLKLPENKVIITVAQTGALVTKAQNPNLPEQPEEIAASACECYNEGAAIVHIHARDRDGVTTGSADVFRDIHERIRKRCSLILQDSTGGGANLTIEQRTECVEARPEMASLNMGTMMRTIGQYKGTPFANSREDIEAFVTRMTEFGVKPEMEVYALSMLREVNNLVDKGLVEKPYYINMIYGMVYQGALEANPLFLPTSLQFLPPDAIFNCLGVGTGQTPIATMGMILGGCVRVGMEDNIYYRQGELATSNAQLVARIARIARELGKEPMTPEEARQILGLKPL
ncbi:3-keto-5-aminohexanoate cleavage protein [Chloroflexota bacterium]